MPFFFRNKTKWGQIKLTVGLFLKMDELHLSGFREKRKKWDLNQKGTLTWSLLIFFSHEIWTKLSKTLLVILQLQKKYRHKLHIE